MQAILVKHETFLRYNPIQQILEATLEVKKSFNRTDLYLELIACQACESDFPD